MIEQTLEYLDHAGSVISLAGVVVILGGFLLAAGRYASQFFQLGPARDFAQFKIQLGQATMLGLEISGCRRRHRDDNSQTDIRIAGAPGVPRGYPDNR